MTAGDVAMLFCMLSSVFVHFKEKAYNLFLVFDYQSFGQYLLIIRNMYYEQDSQENVYMYKLLTVLKDPQ